MVLAFHCLLLPPISQCYKLLIGFQLTQLLIVTFGLRMFIAGSEHTSPAEMLAHIRLHQVLLKMPTLQQRLVNHPQSYYK